MCGLCGLGVLTIVIATDHVTSQNKIEARLDKIRKAGYPATSSELNEWHATLPDVENAALIYQEAIDLLVQASRSSPNLPVFGQAEWPKSGSELPPGVEKAIANHLAANEHALNAVRRASTLTRCRYPLDFRQGHNLLLPHLASLKALAQLLRLETGYYALHDKPDLAVRSVITGVALAQSLADEPLLISNLVRIACLAITLQGLEHVVSENTLSDTQILSLAKALHRAEASSQEAFLRAMAGERSLGVSFFLASTSEQASLHTGSNKVEIQDRALVALYRISGIFGKDFRFFLDTFDDMIQAFHEPYPDSIRRSEEAQKQSENEFGTLTGQAMLISRTMLPALSKAFEKEARLVALLRAALAGLAVEQYRHAHSDSFPVDLTTLVPEYLDSVPTDPFDGKPLELERLGEGFRVLCPGASKALQGRNRAQKPQPVAFSVTN